MHNTQFLPINEGLMCNFKTGVKCGDARDPQQGGSHATYCPTSLYVAKYET